MKRAESVILAALKRSAENMKVKSRAVRNLVLLAGFLLLVLISFGIGRWYEREQIKQELKISVIGAVVYERSTKVPYKSGMLAFKREDIRGTGSTPHSNAVFIEFGDELLVTTIKKPEDIEGVTFPARKQDVE